jgi:hypothetical protein
MSLLHDVLSYLAKCSGADVYQATVQAFGSGVCVQKFASTRRVDGHDAYNPKGRSIPLPSLRRGGRRHLSCLNFCKTVESIIRAYHGVDGGCSRGEIRAGGGFTSHSGRFATARREFEYGASPQVTSRVGQSATRGASPKSTARNAQHQWLTESHIRPEVGSLPTGQAAAVHYAQAGAVGDCASRNDGVSAGIEASGVAALTSLGGDWSGQSGDELVARGRAHSVETRPIDRVPMEPFVREEIPLDPKDMGWVDGDELRRQVASRAIEDATSLDYVAPAFVVVQSSGKRRVGSWTSTSSTRRP